jgi:hypothetical protein
MSLMHSALSACLRSTTLMHMSKLHLGHVQLA